MRGGFWNSDFWISLRIRFWILDLGSTLRPCHKTFGNCAEPLQIASEEHGPLVLGWFVSCLMQLLVFLFPRAHDSKTHLRAHTKIANTTTRGRKAKRKRSSSRKRNKSKEEEEDQEEEKFNKHNHHNRNHKHKNDKNNKAHKWQHLACPWDRGSYLKEKQGCKSAWLYMRSVLGSLGWYWQPLLQIWCLLTKVSKNCKAVRILRVLMMLPKYYLTRFDVFGL